MQIGSFVRCERLGCEEIGESKGRTRPPLPVSWPRQYLLSNAQFPTFVRLDGVTLHEIHGQEDLKLIVEQ